MKYVYNDAEFGEIEVTANSRAKSIILKIKPEGICATVPAHATADDLKKTIEKFREQLRKKAANIRKPQMIDGRFQIKTDLMQLTFAEGNTKNFTVTRKKGEVVIYYPPQTDFSKPEMQEWLQQIIINQLRIQAKTILPPMLMELSKKYNLPITDIRINSSTTRWGSCSGRKSINLSLYMMQLPKHLINYILTHELAHTVEMNHSDRFWALVDKLLGQDSRAIRKELKNYTTSVV